MASLEYVMAGWFRSTRLMVASVSAGRGYGGRRPRPFPRQAGGSGPGDFLLGVGRLGGRSQGSPLVHLRGSSLMYLVPLWALLSGVTRWMGRALIELQGLALWLVRSASALVKFPLAVPLHPDLQPTVWARALEATGSCPHTRSSRPCGRCGKVDRLSCLFETVGTFRAGAVPVAGGRMMKTLGQAGGGVQWGGRRVGPEGRGGCGRVEGCCAAVSSGLLGARGRCACFSSRSLRRDWRWWDWGGVGLEEGVSSLLAGVP